MLQSLDAYREVSSPRPSAGAGTTSAGASVTRQAAEEPQTAANAEAATVQPDTTPLEKAP